MKKKKVIITALFSISLALALVACKNTKLVWEETDSMIELETTYWTETFSISGYIINLKSPIEAQPVTFSISVDEGLLAFDTINEDGERKVTFGKSDDIVSGGQIVWTNRNSAPPYENYPYYDVETAFIDVIVKEENHIIGYAVIKIYRTSIPSEVNPNEMVQVYGGEVLASSVLPKLNGNYQVISEEEILDIIKNIKHY